jgi:hypothetical protein
VLQVFPFRFVDPGFDWSALVRVLLVLGLVGSAIGVVAVVRGDGPGRRTGRRTGRRSVDSGGGAR